MRKLSWKGARRKLIRWLWRDHKAFGRIVIICVVGERKKWCLCSYPKRSRLNWSWCGLGSNVLLLSWSLRTWIAHGLRLSWIHVAIIYFKGPTLLKYHAVDHPQCEICQEKAPLQRKARLCTSTIIGAWDAEIVKQTNHNQHSGEPHFQLYQRCCWFHCFSVEVLCGNKGRKFQNLATLMRQWAKVKRWDLGFPGSGEG